MQLSLSQIAKALSATLPEKDRDIDILLTDSRSLSHPSSSIFFALPSSGPDGHCYVEELYGKGVRAFVVSQDVNLPADATVLKVPDTLEALQKLGALAGNLFRGLRVGITGSRGKTVVKEWIFRLLYPEMHVARSPRSFNSQIGVPLSLWHLDPEAQIGIIEAGISRKGEMDRLADMIRPEIVVITNLLDDHDEGFQDKEEKLQEKLRLADAPGVREVIAPADNPTLREKVEEISGPRKILWSLNDAPDVAVTGKYHRVNATEGEIDYRLNRSGKTGHIRFPALHDFNAENAMSALCFLLVAGLKPEEIEKRFSRVTEIATRFDVMEGVNGCTLINDTYTCDADSLHQALDFMRRRYIPGSRPTVILSSLIDAEDSGTLAEKITSLLADYGIQRVITVGSDWENHKDLLPPSTLTFPDTESLLDSLSTSDFENEIILVKGSAEFDFSRIMERLEARKHETVLEVNLDSIVKNFNYFRSFLPASTGLVAMVKASGYGAGSYEVAKTMQEHGAAYLAVAVIDEGIDLRGRGITMPIMVMNPKVVNYKSMFANHLEPEIYSMEMLDDVIREARKNGVKDYPIHIKLDTGMHRMGFVEEELPLLMDKILAQDEVAIKSAFSHLATADCPDMNDYTELQLGRFKDYTDYLQSRYDRKILRHVLNSAGILRFPAHHYDMARLGIGLYGVNTLPPDMEAPLAVVSSLKTIIISIRDWKKGETIGYGRRGVLERDSKIATIPIGYADGMNRHFGRGAIKVLVNGKEAPTIGNICMDACMIDVTGIECKVGDSVEIFGENMPVDRLADVLDTIPYEVLTSVSPRVKRIYYRE